MEDVKAMIADMRTALCCPKCKPPEGFGWIVLANPAKEAEGFLQCANCEEIRHSIKILGKAETLAYFGNN